MDDLQEVLRLNTTGVKPCARANEIPYLLRDDFQFSELELLGQPVVLGIGHEEAKQSLSEVRIWLDKVKALAGQPTAYVVNALASYDRRRLMEQKVSFIVPGNQLYLPDLGFDLREYFRRRAPATQVTLSPSAQAKLRDLWPALALKTATLPVISVTCGVSSMRGAKRAERPGRPRSWF